MLAFIKLVIFGRKGSGPTRAGGADMIDENVQAKPDVPVLVVMMTPVFIGAAVALTCVGVGLAIKQAAVGLLPGRH